MRIRRIVLDSIKENPHAGRTKFPVAGKSQTVVNEDGTITSTRNVAWLHSMTPDPPHLFRWEPMDVKCGNCDAVFPIEDLGDDYYFDGSEEYPVSDICPKCKAPDCVEEQIQYETIEQALERKKA